MALEPTLHRFTVEEYERLWHQGTFGDRARVELLDGEVFHTVPIGPRHANCVARLDALLHRRLADRAVVRVQSPAPLGDFSEPEPGLVALRPGFDRYDTRHPNPSDVLLLVEVSDTALAFDRSRKLPIYARAGVPEAWIVDIEGEAVEVHREPGPDGYQAVERHGRGARVAPLAFPDAALAVDEILG
jgi:Uma2 family endonuclease